MHAIKESGIANDRVVKPEELNSIISDVDSQIAVGALEHSKTVGIVLVHNPTGKTEYSDRLQVGKYEDHNFLVYEIFSPTASDSRGVWVGFVSSVVSDSIGQLEATGNLISPGLYAEQVIRPLSDKYYLELVPQDTFSVE